MPEVGRTGGAKEFRYSKEDTKRIQKEDTESTEEFKEAYGQWLSVREVERVARKRLHHRLAIALVFAFVMLMIYVVLRWMP
ncbi:hypothetical protein J4439_00720 [Candidatus Woesearchaeota archaeon]|nr:hypothetical protein [Candidatus Woesearchaeota archaeon]